MKDLCLPAEAAIDKAMLTYDPEEQIDGPDPITVVSRTNDGTVLDVATVDIDESAWVTDSTVATTPLTSQGEQVVTLPNLCNNVYVTVNVPLIKRLVAVSFVSYGTQGTGSLVYLTSFTYTSVAINNVSLARYTTILIIGDDNANWYTFDVRGQQGNSATVSIPAKSWYYIYTPSDSDTKNHVDLYVLDANNLSTPVYYGSLADSARADTISNYTAISRNVLLVSTD